MERFALLLFVSLGLFGMLSPLVDEFSVRVFRRRLSPLWAILGVAIGLGASISLLSIKSRLLLFAGTIMVDQFAAFFSVIFLAVTAFLIVSSTDYMKGDENQGVYFGLLLLSTLGMVIIAFAADLLVLYLAWELMSIPTYVLVGIKKREPTSNEAALKYFLISALSSGLIVYAISLLFGVSGSTSIFKVADYLSSESVKFQPLLLLGVALLIAGFGMKFAAVPFHMWLPDAYEGSPITIGAFLAAGSKNGAFAATLRVFAVSLILFRLNWSAAFAAIALLTMTLGNVAALTQRSFTRLLAYSSIAHSGYILIGLAAPTAMGIGGALFHILNHAVMKTGAFVAAAAVYSRLSTTTLDGYNGLGRRMPLTAFTLTFSLLALAGVPPLNGFISKLILFTAAIDAQIGWLAVAGVLNSAFSLAYYGWIVKRMYFDDPTQSGKIVEPPAYTSVLVAITILTVLIGVYPEPVIILTRTIASTL